ncbi:hypothetical protein E2C01_041518 [Portunus trituberculatus]|uniref:Uncharacterized protein n=1 Tax=Portunus trituberculatus TaxID=210409 RepID=A0A5B7FMU1_PORTR|nr:hypothetical protein [Portunus trituberculatus]
MRMETVGKNRKESTVSYLRHLYFNEEKKMRFNREEVKFYKLKIKLKTANVAQVNKEKIQGMSRYLGSILEEEFEQGISMVPFPDGDFDAGFGVTIIS